MAGCGSAGTRRSSPDDAVRARAAGAARTLADDYETALVRGGIDRDQAAMYRDHHSAHVKRLTGSAVATTGTATAVAAAATAASPTRASLAAAERTAADTGPTDLAVASGDLAALLASIAACRALHAQALVEAPPTAGARNPIAPTLATTASDRVSTDALQAVLSAENAVIFAFGALGPHLTDRRRATAHAAFDLHRSQRDVLMDAIAARGASPRAAEASYVLPFPVGDAASACRLAGLVETRLAAVCALAVSKASGDSRTYAAWSLTQASLRAQAWGTPATAFPGLGT